MIRIVETVEQAREAARRARRDGRTVGLVPTMGALHHGHGRLIERCRAEADLVVVSVFVNPTQFGPHEDFDRYPRTFDADHALCEAAGADLIFAPAVRTMYPSGNDPATFVEVPGLSDVFEGAVRPGHFRGVATVVLKLFTITEPDLAFFGAKDFQQQLVIRRMVSDLNLPVTVRTVETVREADGLAMSSRNRYLDPSQREAATVLSRALWVAKRAVEAGERKGDRVRQILAGAIESEPSGKIDYAEVVDAADLRPLDMLTDGRAAVGLLAVRFGTTRLIDNAVLTSSAGDGR